MRPCEPGSVKEALAFASGAFAAGVPWFLFRSYFSVPPLHRTSRMLQADLAVALGVCGALALIGTLVFRTAQAWRRRRDTLFPRTLQCWLPLGLGACWLAGSVALIAASAWLRPFDDPTPLAVGLCLALNVALSRLGWRSAES